MKNLIKESDKAIIYQFDENHFEVWIKIHWTIGPKKGELIEPKDEDFGVTAWNSYTLERAMNFYNQINEGKRGITPMVESPEF